MGKNDDLNYFGADAWKELVAAKAKRGRGAVKGARVAVRPRPAAKDPKRSKIASRQADARRANMLRACEAAYKAKTRRRQRRMEEHPLWHDCLVVMRPGEWHTVRQIAEAQGYSDGVRSDLADARRAAIHAAIRRDMWQRHGMVERMERPRTEADGYAISDKVVLYRLTERGAALREALV